MLRRTILRPRTFAPHIRTASSYTRNFVWQASTDQARDLAGRDIGKMFRLDPSQFPLPDHLLAEKEGKLGAPHVLLTETRMQLVKSLLTAQTERDRGQFVHSYCGLAGATGEGKSTTILLLAYMAKQLGWHVLYLPDGWRLVGSSLRLNEVLGHVMKDLAAINRESLADVLQEKPKDNLATNKEAKTMGELLELGTREGSNSTEIFGAYLRNLKTSGRLVFAGIDDWDAYRGDYEHSHKNHQSCRHHPVYNQFAQLRAFPLRGGLYLTAAHSIKGYMLNPIVTGTEHQMISDVPPLKSTEVSTLMEYYAAQGFIGPDDKHRLIGSVASRRSCHLGMLSRVVRTKELPDGKYETEQVHQGRRHLGHHYHHRGVLVADVSEHEEQQQQQWQHGRHIRAEAVRKLSEAALEHFFCSSLISCRSKIILPRPLLDEQEHGKGPEIFADSERIIRDTQRYRLVPLRSGQLLRFYRDHPGCNFFLKWPGQYFFIKFCAHDVLRPQHHAEKVFQQYVGESTYSPYTLVSRCLEKGNEGPLPRDGSEEFWRDVHMVYITTSRHRSECASRRMKTIYVMKDDFYSHFDMDSVDTLFHALEGYRHAQL